MQPVGGIIVTSDNKGGIGPALLAFCIHFVNVVLEKPAAGMLLLSALLAECIHSSTLSCEKLTAGILPLTALLAASRWETH